MIFNYFQDDFTEKRDFGYFFYRSLFILFVQVPYFLKFKKQ